MAENSIRRAGSEQGDDGTPAVGLPVRRRIAEGQPLVFANDMAVQHGADDFVLSFFQISPPLLAEDPREQARQLEELGGIDAYCVARIVVTPGHMRRIVQAMQQNLEHYQALLRQGVIPGEEMEE